MARQYPGFGRSTRVIAETTLITFTGQSYEINNLKETSLKRKIKEYNVLINQYSNPPVTW
jgi:hypothetical protein